MLAAAREEASERQRRGVTVRTVSIKRASEESMNKNCVDKGRDDREQDC